MLEAWDSRRFGQTREDFRRLEETWRSPTDLRRRNAACKIYQNVREVDEATNGLKFPQRLRNRSVDASDTDSPTSRAFILRDVRHVEM